MSNSFFTRASYRRVANPTLLADQVFYSGFPSLRQVAYHGYGVLSTRHVTLGRAPCRVLFTGSVEHGARIKQGHAITTNIIDIVSRRAKSAHFHVFENAYRDGRYTSVDVLNRFL
jgi:hypothetical protein